MKRNMIVRVLSGFFGSALLLILLGATGSVGARSANVRSDVSHANEVSAATPLTSTFTYQGQLKNGGNPITAACDFQFGLWDSLSGGTQIGITQTLSAVSVNAGYFTTLINSGNPFGINGFNGSQRWLAITVRCPAGSGGYTAFNQRQQLTAAPYALYSAAPWVTNGSDLSYMSGKVGIGTTSPSSRLEIAAQDGLALTGFQPFLTLRDTNNANKRSIIQGADGKIIFYPDSFIGGAPAMVINNVGGTVGIGTTNPLATLDVNGDIRGTSLTAPANLFLNASTGRIALRTTDGGPYAERMTILPNGNVGIGTTSPAAKLDVVGKLQVTGVDTFNSEALRVTDSAGGLILSAWDDGSITVRPLGIRATTEHVCITTSGTLALCGSAAEYVPTIDSGLGFPETADLVSIAPAMKNPYGDTHSSFTVQKSATACDTNLLGFIVKPESGADGVKLNDHYLPLAIYGYFPAKVTVENGAIKRGDALTSSSKPGYGMKATQACKIIGYALEDADHEGQIQVFANHGESTAPAVTSLQAQVKELQDQNVSLDARLTALEQTQSEQTPAPSAPSRDVVLFGALFAIGGIVVGRRTNLGGRS